MSSPSSRTLEVHWITYPATGERGWATVAADNPNDWIFYGGALGQAIHQARIANEFYGSGSDVKVRTPTESLMLHYEPYQWM